jgi:polysaccharide lyase-like protein
MSRTKLMLLSIGLLVLVAGLRNEIVRALPTDLFHFNSPRPSTTSSAPAHPGTVVWSADMETGDLSQWSAPDVPSGPHTGGGVFNSGLATARVDAVGLAHSGLHSATLFVNTQSAEELPTSGTRLFRWLEPEKYPELYYCIWFYFPQRYVPNGNPPWWNVFQWKSKRGDTSDPFIALNVGNRPDGAMYFYAYDKNAKNSYGQSIKNIPEERWVRIDAFYKCSGEKNGQITFWQDGTQILDIGNVQTRYPDGNCSWSVNNYSTSLNPSTATIYVDDAAICLGGRCP